MKRSGGGIHSKGGNNKGGKEHTPNKTDGVHGTEEEKLGQGQGQGQDKGQGEGEEKEKGKEQEGEDTDIEWTVDHEAVGKRVAAHFPPVKGKKGGPGRGRKGGSKATEVCYVHKYIPPLLCSLDSFINLYTHE